MKKREINLKKVMDSLDDETSMDLSQLKNKVSEILPVLSKYVEKDLIKELEGELKCLPNPKIAEEVYENISNDIYNMIKTIPQYILNDIKNQINDEEIKKCLFSICMSLVCYLRSKNKIMFKGGK